MPPQVSGTGGSRTPAPQAPLPQEQKNEVTSTKTQNASNAPAADKSTEVQEREDPKAAAKTAEALKQHATEQKGQHNTRAQLLQKNLQNEVPGLAKQQAPSPQIPEYRPMGKKTEDRKPGDPQHAENPATEAKTANTASASKTDHSAGAARHHKSKTEKPKTQSTSAPPPHTEFDSAHDSVRLRGKELGIDKDVENAKRLLLATRVGELAGQPEMLQGAMIPGKLFEVEHIRPSDVNRTGTAERSRENPPVVGDVVQHGRHTINTRAATGSGLKDRLTELADGPLTPFEKKMVDEWQTPSKWGGTKVLVPIMGFNDKEKGVQAYKVVEGQSGHKVTTHYDRQGNVLREKHTGGETYDGLDPFTDVVAARLAKGGGSVSSRGRSAANEADATGSPAKPSGAKGRTVTAGERTAQEGAKTPTTAGGKTVDGTPAGAKAPEAGKLKKDFGEPAKRSEVKQTEKPGVNRMSTSDKKGITDPTQRRQAQQIIGERSTIRKDLVRRGANILEHEGIDHVASNHKSVTAGLKRIAGDPGSPRQAAAQELLDLINEQTAVINDLSGAMANPPTR